MAFNFNNNPSIPGPPGETSPTPLSAAPPATSEAPDAQAPSSPVTSYNPHSAAFVRFGSCRWQQPAEDGNAAFCTHREVKPYAGTAGFDADAWCPECQYYKLRRAPKKREPRDEYSY